MAKTKKHQLAVTDKKTLHQNLSFIAKEQYKMLRTNLNFVLPDDLKCPIIGVTSSVRGEGKSTTAINLAYALAEDGKTVLLIDGDLRLPSIAKKLGYKNQPGLTDFLQGGDTKVYKTNIHENWYVMMSGNIPPNPSELLGELDNCVRQLKLSNVNVLGCVMNNAKDEKAAYGKYGKYGKYKSYYYQQPESEELPSAETVTES